MAPYSDEIAALPATYATALRTLDGKQLDRARTAVTGRDLYAIGSGGTIVVAELAADFHRIATGRAAAALTPLRFVETAASIDRGVVVLFSAQARHPDTAFAATTALAHGIPIVLFTQRDRADLSGPLASAQVTVITLPSDTGKDGFLATQSVLTMAVAAAATYFPQTLPEELTYLSPSDNAPLRRRLVVLHGHAGFPAARDIEVRMHELGLADVQLADWRNLAHGRHVGLRRNEGSTTVIALVSPETAQIARRTLAALPESVDIRVIETEFDGVTGSVHLLSAVMQLPLLTTPDDRLEPSKPKVAPWGRELYHLPFKRMFPSTVDNPGLRKAKAAGFSSENSSAVDIYTSAYNTWLTRVRKTPIDVLVVDYDGTCVATPDRWDPPTQAVQTAILRVLELDLPIVFATGRGDSLYEGLRAWVPEKHWSRIRLGLHNGAWIQELSQPLLEPAMLASEWTSRLRERLRPFVDTSLITIRLSGTQLAINSVDSSMSVNAVFALVSSLTGGMEKHLRVASSAHSVDVIDANSGKEYVFATAQKEWGNALAVGDRGGLGGNDYGLLSASTLSITVDECSPDPSRCWPVTDADVRGPQALVVVLDALQPRRGRLHLTVKNRKLEQR
jgi:hydroxymethylpyrimidine pyrophosphatase-like HAD family hydrolase